MTRLLLGMAWQQNQQKLRQVLLQKVSEQYLYPEQPGPHSALSSPWLWVVRSRQKIISNTSERQGRPWGHARAIGKSAALPASTAGGQ